MNSQGAIASAVETLLSEDSPPGTLALLQRLSLDDDLLYDVLQSLLDEDVIEDLGPTERARLNQRLRQVSEWRARRMGAAAAGEGGEGEVISRRWTEVARRGRHREGSSTSSGSVQQPAADDQSVPDSVAPGTAREAGGATGSGFYATAQATTSTHLYDHNRGRGPSQPLINTATSRRGQLQGGRGAGVASVAQQVEQQLQSAGDSMTVLHGGGGGLRVRVGDDNHETAGNTRSGRGSGDRASLGGGASEPVRVVAASTATGATAAAAALQYAGYRLYSGSGVGHSIAGTGVEQAHFATTGGYDQIADRIQQARSSGATCSLPVVGSTPSGDDGNTAEEMAVATALLSRYQEWESLAATASEHHHGETLPEAAMGGGEDSVTMRQTGILGMQEFLAWHGEADMMQATSRTMQLQQCTSIYPSSASWPPSSQVAEMRPIASKDVQLEITSKSAHERMTDHTPLTRSRHGDDEGHIRHSPRSTEDQGRDSGRQDDFRLFGVDMRPQR